MTAYRPSRKESRSWKARRKKAEQLFEAGERQTAVARALGVSRQCVHNWFWQWQGGDASRPRGLGYARSGRKSKLDATQLAKIDMALRNGPQSFGFTAERWTLWRVAAVIEQITGIRYHPSSIWRILRAMGWELHLPPLGDGKATGYIARHWTPPLKPQTARSPDE